MMKYYCLIILLISNVVYCQIGLGVKLKKVSENKILVEITDSLEYVPNFEEFQPTKFELEFIGDTLSRCEFQFMVFGNVKVPQEPLIETSEAEIFISGKNVYLQLRYFNSYYKEKFYIINGQLGKVDSNGFQTVIPIGTNIVKSGRVMFIHQISKKGITTKRFMGL